MVLFHPSSHERLLILLKKGDQLLIGNKRGLTLLNCALKILTKLYQLRLSIVLQVFIIEHHATYFLGRSTHHSLIFKNKVLIKEKKLEKDFVLLKLDTIKTFDYLGWLFLYALLKKLGFGPKFFQMLKATNVMPILAILILGH